MPGCGAETCSCVIQAGSGINVTGSGTMSDPFVVTSALELAQALRVNDTDTINLTLVGGGVASDPFVLSGVATVKMTQLADVQDVLPIAPGDVPTYVGAWPSGHWEFSAPTPPPAGTVNVGDGLTGTGAAGTPLKVKVVGTTAGGATTGLEVYVDSAGNLRTVAPVATAVDWSTITGKPASYPPSAHTHVAADITDPLNLSVGNSAKVRGIQIFSGPTTPTGPAQYDLWFKQA